MNKTIRQWGKLCACVQIVSTFQVFLPKFWPKKASDIHKLVHSFLYEHRVRHQVTIARSGAGGAKPPTEICDLILIVTFYLDKFYGSEKNSGVIPLLSSLVYGPDMG